MFIRTGKLRKYVVSVGKPPYYGHEAKFSYFKRDAMNFSEETAKEIVFTVAPRLVSKGILPPFLER